MVEVEFQSLRKIVVHEAIEHEVADLVRLRVLGLRRDSIAPPFVWAEGVLFSRSSAPPTDDVVRQQMEGTIHFFAIEWALMPKYKKVLKSEGVTIPVINVNDNPSLCDLAKALKKRHKKS